MLELVLAFVVGFVGGYAVHYFSKGKTKTKIEDQLNNIKDRVDK